MTGFLAIASRRRVLVCSEGVVQEHFSQIHFDPLPEYTGLALQPEG